MGQPAIQQPDRTIHQIVDDQGRPLTACHTEPLWVDRSQTNVFAEPTAGNKIMPFTTGKEYFANLIGACNAAPDNSEIYITGWQVNWDALLEPGLRLYDLLFRCAKRGINIYVMPWDDSEPVQTYDDQTKTVLESLNARLEEGKFKGRVHVELCKSYAEINNSYFSHHQKQVLINREIAFVGGMDLCYGRMDDVTYDLHADKEGRQVLNRYNPGIPPVQTVSSDKTPLVDPDKMTGLSDKSKNVDPITNKVEPSNAEIQQAAIEAGGWQIAYNKAGMVDIIANNSHFSSNNVSTNELDPACQPRMPWQDVHCRIEGPAVSDLLRNFILRWNTVSQKNKLKLPKPPKDFPQLGNAEIQVLRSAPAKHCATENKANNVKDVALTQQDIHVAMKNLIAKARRFIYIENQFFVSDFGEIGGPQGTLTPAAQYIKDGQEGIQDWKLWVARKASHGQQDEIDRLPQNGILKALLARLQNVIVDDFSKPPFHIYITLPVHPEGALYEGSIATQVYFTMQTLVFGSHSLINGIRRFIKARELKDQGDDSYMRVITDIFNTEYDSVPTEACYEYVTLLNLRNWEKLSKDGQERYVTEQIYVHSKLMIVDDRFALLGSANINDRSMLGERDSEIAVLVMDMDTQRADINGKGSNQPVRKFAHELRKQIWTKLFGIAGKVRPADNLKDAIEEPGCPASWRMIQAQAAKNTELYEAAFPFIPRNKDPDPKRANFPAKILPTWDPSIGKNGGLGKPMPFQEDFWRQFTHTDDATNLSRIKGFITALPIEWTKDENNRIPYPSAIVVENERIKHLPLEHASSFAMNETSDLSPKG